jgi:hypothetical protein
MQDKDSFDSEDDDADTDSGDGSKEASTLVGQKHKSDTVLEGAAKRNSYGSGGSAAHSAPVALPGAKLGATLGTAHGTNSAPRLAPGPVRITLTPEQLRALQAIANRQCQTNVSGEFFSKRFVRWHDSPCEKGSSLQV